MTVFSSTTTSAAHDLWTTSDTGAVVHIHQGAGYISVCDTGTGIFGVGKTFAAAQQDLRDARREHACVARDWDKCTCPPTAPRS